MGFKITIDGYAATGKGTVTKEIAKKLNILQVDSGSLYRTFGLYVIENNVDITNEQEIEDAIIKSNITLGADAKVYIGDRDVSSLIRTEQVAKVTSQVAKLKKVREYILKIQRGLSKEQDVIMEGRDIGSEVFPDAELKIFLNADVEERAKRRYLELVNKGKNVNFEEVRTQLIERDKEDSTREISPLIKTEDMIEIDTTNMTPEQVIDKILGLVKEKGLGCF